MNLLGKAGTAAIMLSLFLLMLTDAELAEGALRRSGWCCRSPPAARYLRAGGGPRIKAVVMAGGEGTRLRPLTSNQPKPMVPIVGKPCMEHIIELLRRHGIDEIVVTVAYLPQVIRGYFGDGESMGVTLHYSVEETPLGTAGSVKHAEALLDETFLVISGDALCDFDLTAIVAAHHRPAARRRHWASSRSRTRSSSAS